MKPLETSRLFLRPLTPADAATVLELVNEPAWLAHIGDRGVRTIADAERYLEGPARMRANHGFALDAVVRKDDGAVLGICGLIKRDTLAEVDLGFAFFARYWGFGYAREAAEAVLRDARVRLRLARVVAVVSSGNARSLKLLAALGFGFERDIVLSPGAEPIYLYARSLTVDAGSPVASAGC